MRSLDDTAHPGDFEQKSGPRPVVVLGHHELDYPRNQSLQRALDRVGRSRVVCHSHAPFPFRHVVLAAKLLAAPTAAKVVLVTEGGHRLVPWVKLLCRMTGRRVVFDPFTSRYDTRVVDRGWFEPGSLQAKIAHFQDWSSTRAADFLLFDTDEHREYFYSRYGLDGPCAVVRVGVPEQLFTPRVQQVVERTRLEVLFYGTYVPLQGVEIIVEAAALLRSGPHRFTLIGEGQSFDSAQARAHELGLEAPQFVQLPPIAFEALPERLADADVVLGIFGTSAKASRVVPNKVVQAAAMGRPIISADTPAMRRYFEQRESALLVPPGDAPALASAVRELAVDADLRLKIGAGARRVFEESFSDAVATRTLADVLKQLEE